MKVISRPRAGGKTTQLVKWLMEKPEERGILVQHREAKNYIIRMLVENGVKNAEQLSIEDWDSFMLGRTAINEFRGKRKPKEIAIDDADRFLMRYLSRFGNEISLISITEEL